MRGSKTFGQIVDGEVLILILMEYALWDITIMEKSVALNMS